MPSFEHIQDALLNVLLPPALVAAALMGLACWAAKGRIAVSAVGSAVGMAAGMALGSWWCGGVLPLARMPGTPAWEWLPWVTLAALAVGAAGCLSNLPSGVGPSLRGLVAGYAGWLLAPRDLREELWWVPLVLGAVVLAEWAVLDSLDWGGFLPLALAPVALTASVVLIHAGSLRFNQIMTILAGTLLGTGVAALLLRGSARAIAGGVAVILPGLLLLGWHETYSAVPWASFALPALSPLLLAASLWTAPDGNRKGWWAVQATLLVLPLAVAFALAAQSESLDYE